MPLWMWYALCAATLLGIVANELRPRAQRVSATPRPLSLPVQIVCGNCSGEQSRPLITHLTRDGRCDVCRGTHFEYRQRFVRAPEPVVLPFDLIEGRTLG